MENAGKTKDTVVNAAPKDAFDPEDGKDCDGEFVDLPNPHEEIRKQRDALHSEVTHLKYINGQLMDALHDQTGSILAKTRASLEATSAELLRWRNAPRIQISAIGHAHDGLYAKVPEGER